MDKYVTLFSRHGLSLDRLHTLCKIADEGGLAKAAGRDAGRMSLYSRQVKELEEFFGTDLTEREGRRMRLTEAGRQLARLAREQLESLASFQRTAQKSPQVLSLGAGNSVLEWLLMPRLKTLQQRAPALEMRLFNLTTREVVQQVADGQIDVGIARSEAIPAALKSKPLRRVRYALYVPAALAQGVTMTNLRERMDSLPIATSMGGSFRESLEEAAARAGWPLRIVLSCSSFTQAARAAQSGAMAAILPDLAEADLAGTALKRFDLPFISSHERRLSLVWIPRSVDMKPWLAQAIRCLFDAVRQDTD